MSDSKTPSADRHRQEPAGRRAAAARYQDAQAAHARSVAPDDVTFVVPVRDPPQQLERLSADDHPRHHRGARMVVVDKRSRRPGRASSSAPHDPPPGGTRSSRRPRHGLAACSTAFRRLRRLGRWSAEGRRGPVYWRVSLIPRSPQSRRACSPLEHRRAGGRRVRHTPLAARHRAEGRLRGAGADQSPVCRAPSLFFGKRPAIDARLRRGPARSACSSTSSRASERADRGSTTRPSVDVPARPSPHHSSSSSPAASSTPVRSGFFRAAIPGRCPHVDRAGPRRSPQR